MLKAFDLWGEHPNERGLDLKRVLSAVVLENAGRLRDARCYTVGRA
jgi:hypothetical protein